MRRANDFQDRVVLVTGASRGIGAATARTFAARGAQVIVNYRERKQDAEDVVAEIGAGGGRAVAVQGDVGREDDVRRMLSEAAAAFGPVTILVHNAAAGSTDAFLDVSLEAFDHVFSTVVRGPFLMSQLAAQAMIAAGQGGSIIHVSTILARLAIPKRTLYVAAKSAIEGLTRAMALDLVAHNIRVNAVAPGLIDTDALRGVTTRLGEARFLEYLPGGRFGEPGEIAEAIAYLASDAASYITGVVLPVDHGLGVREFGPPDE